MLVFVYVLKDLKIFLIGEIYFDFGMVGMFGFSLYVVFGIWEFFWVCKFDMEERRRRIFGNFKYDIVVMIIFIIVFN